MTLCTSVSLLVPLAVSAAETGTEPVTRAAFVQMIVERFYDQEQLDGCLMNLSLSKYTLLFRDVDRDASYAKAVCVGMVNGFVRGYSDGTFRPEKPVNLAEAAKIIARVVGTTPATASGQDDPWYRPYVESLTLRHAVPASVKTFDQVLTRADVIDMLTRLESGNTSNPSPTYESLERRSVARWKQS